MQFNLSDKRREHETKALELFCRNIKILALYDTVTLHPLVDQHLPQSQWQDAEKAYLRLSREAGLIVDSFFTTLCGWSIESLFNAMCTKQPTDDIALLVQEEMETREDCTFEQTALFLTVLAEYDAKSQQDAESFLQGVMPEYQLLTCANTLFTTIITINNEASRLKSA